MNCDVIFIESFKVSPNVEPSSTINISFLTSKFAYQIETGQLFSINNIPTGLIIIPCNTSTLIAFLKNVQTQPSNSTPGDISSNISSDSSLYSVSQEILVSNTPELENSTDLNTFKQPDNIYTTLLAPKLISFTSFKPSTLKTTTTLKPTTTTRPTSTTKTTTKTTKLTTAIKSTKKTTTALKPTTTTKTTLTTKKVIATKQTTTTKTTTTTTSTKPTIRLFKIKFLNNKETVFSFKPVSMANKLKHSTKKNLKMTVLSPFLQKFILSH